jgi:hypothetical protein
MYLHRSARPRGSAPDAPRPLDWASRLEILGTGNQPVKETRAFRVTLRAQDTDQPSPRYPASIGAIIQVRPSIVGGVWLPTRAFDHAWAMATSGQLRYLHLSFTTPKRSTAFIMSASFSNTSDDDEEEAGIPDDGAREEGSPLSEGRLPGSLPEAS